MKNYLLVLVAFFSLTSTAWASFVEEFRLNHRMEMRVAHGNSGTRLHFAGRLPPGTIVEIDTRERLRGWLEVRNIRTDDRRVERDRDFQRAQDDLRYSTRSRFYIESDVTYLGDFVRPYRPAPPVHPVRPPSGGFNAYQVCYEQPYQRWHTQNEQQARNGRRNTAIGIIGIIGGQIIGGDVGDVISIGSAVLAGVGLVQIASSQSPVTYYDTRCDTYYTRDTRTYRHQLDGRSCTTYRYYSRDWNREVEYFRTTCSGNSFYTFERSSRIWY